MQKEIREATIKILTSKRKKPTYEEAKKALQELGVVDNEGNIVDFYKEFFIKVEDKSE